MKKIILGLLLLVAFTNLSAQNKLGWGVEFFGNSTYKLTYTYEKSSNNENFTNATIAKPLAFTNPESVYTITNDTVLFLENLVKIYPAGLDNEFKKLSVSLTNLEQIYGGGERALPLNRRGYQFNFWNNPWYAYGLGADNLNYSIPYFLSSQGYALFFDNGSKGYADIGKKNANVLEVGFSSGQLNVYIIFGSTYAQILQNYHKLTGTQPMPPRWAMGNLMSRFGYTSEAQVNEIAGKMKAAKIPFDAIIYDLFWFGDSIKGSLGNLDWVNKKNWPNPVKMIANYKAKNIKTTLITEPFILENTKSHNEAKKYFATNGDKQPYLLTQFYFGKGGLLDIFRKDAAQWIWNYHYKKQIANGVAAWWTDLGEPENHPNDMVHNLTDLGISRKVMAKEVHNIYGHYWNKMLFENYAKEYPNYRLFHLNRSGFAGSQRYSIFPWSGDVGRNWSGLQAQLPVMLGMSICGIPYIHADAGGFAGGDKDPELYIRWLQFASYSPILRPHGTALGEIDPQNTDFASEPALIDTNYLDIARTTVYNRYKLLPYTYTLAYRQAKFGEPIVKPLFYNYKKDAKATSIQSQFLLGDNIMIVPVTEKGQATINCYLPSGFWYEKNSNKAYPGQQFYKMDVSNFSFPVFYKEGSFIPNYNTTGENASEIKRENLSVTYIPTFRPSSYEMYDDDGNSKNAIASNAFELIKFESNGIIEDKTIITIQSNNGIYTGKPLQRNIELLIPTITSKPKSIVINGQLIAIADPTTNKSNTAAFLPSNDSTLANNTNDKIIINITLKQLKQTIIISW
jgi:oligosaccharide 4-alpha-D-glucosyltransferase